MRNKSQLTQKLNDLAYRYGKEAREYFEAHHICEECNEDRLATLNVHHVNGRKRKIFRTLCFNCHILEHHGAKTYIDFMREREVKFSAIAMRNRKIKALRKKEYATRTIARLIGVSHVTVWNVLKGC